MEIICIILIVIGAFHVAKRKKNKYINSHNEKLTDDKDYEDYLEWCKVKGELPLPKKDFFVFRHNEWKFNEQIKKAMK